MRVQAAPSLLQPLTRGYFLALAPEFMHHACTCMQTVNTASRMESTSKEGKIHLSERAASVLKEQVRYSFPVCLTGSTPSAPFSNLASLPYFFFSPPSPLALRGTLSFIQHSGEGM